MSPKAKTAYVCIECGFEAPKWSGKCPACGKWNTMEETVLSPVAAKSPSVVSSVINNAKKLYEIDVNNEHRYYTGLSELDRVLGGGIVKGSLILISGEPGIGKSTILLQVCQHLGQSINVLYVSGEESARQIKIRANRLGVNANGLKILTETDVQGICEVIRAEKPDLVMIDSIQTMNHPEVSSSTGSVTQVRECTNILLKTAKSLDIPMIIVGHVNKDGAIAGPKVLEHIVDAVLYFEGDRQMPYRILRAAKNRYGSTNEIGVFDMSGNGLNQIENPSQVMLEGRPQNASGTCVTAVMEGTRPILAEIQGLASTSGYGNPKRMATGYDGNRVSMILAVLEKRSGYYFSNLDSYVNVVGGLRLDEPSVDLAVALSMISSLKDKPISEDVIVFGEIGLAGEIRSVTHCDARISEAMRLGFKKCILPYYSKKNLQGNYPGIEIIGVKTVREAFEACCE
ncbi:MAG: DNA repair protein RadA [Clostridia bacterium]|nr:DNA repair protein RadA [Clostridia bacterium]